MLVKTCLWGDSDREEEKMELLLELLKRRERVVLCSSMILRKEMVLDIQNS